MLAGCAVTLAVNVLLAAWHPRLWPFAQVAAVAAVGAAAAIGQRRVLRASRALTDDLRAALQQADAVVSVGDLDGGWVADVDGDIEAIMGYTLDEWRSLEFRSLIHPDDVASFWIDVDSIRPGDVIDRTGRLRHADGSWVWIRDVAKVGLDETGRRMIRGFFFDVTVAKEQSRRLAELARTDALTELPNRLALVERLSAAIDAGEQLVLLMLDLDRFKEVNDTLGHEAGDLVLGVVAGRLANTIGPADSLFRLGGDEFAVIAREAPTVTELESRLAAIGAETARPIEVSGVRLVLAVSTGVAFLHAGSDRATLMRHADLAMYAAKTAGEPWRVFDDSLDRSSTIRLSLTAAVESALANHEFELYFQPQVDIRSGVLVGAEGLVRWRHPEFGLLTPEAFLDVVLMSESTAAFTTEMIRQGLEAIGRAQACGLDLPVAVNVSMRALGDVAFAGSVADLLDAGGAPASMLTIEMTENDMAEPSAEVLATLRRLAARGVRISIDDFGTGHSSLARLQTIDVHELKIDRAFVAGVADSRRDRQLAATIIGLADGLGYRVVAQGVETSAQADALSELGCVVAQGFLFSPALPIADLLGQFAGRHPTDVAR